MRLRNKKTGEVVEANKIGLVWNRLGMPADIGDYGSLAELNKEWEDAEGINVPSMPLIKDEKIRKAVRAWADINSLEHFTVINEHFNCCKIMGRKNNRVSKIEFLTTIPNATHRTYTIGELCGGEE